MQSAVAFLCLAICTSASVLKAAQAFPQQPSSTSIQPIQITLQSPPNAYAPMRDAATVVSLILGGVSLFLVLRGHRISERTLQAKICWDTFVLLEGNEGGLRKQRHALQRLVASCVSKGEPGEILDAIANLEDGGDGLHELMRAYDKAGHLVKHGTIPVDFLFDFYSRPIAEAWKYLEPFVNRLRERSGHSNHLRQFEILAAGAALYRQQEDQKEFHQDEPWVFEVSPTVENAWKKWTKNAWMKIR